MSSNSMILSLASLVDFRRRLVAVGLRQGHTVSVRFRFKVGVIASPSLPAFHERSNALCPINGLLPCVLVVKHEMSRVGRTFA